MFNSATQNKCFSSLLNQWMNYTNFKTRIQKYENSQGPTFRTISTGTWLFSRRTTENFWHSATRARSKKRTGCRSMYSAHWRLLSRQLFSVAPKAPWFRKVMPSSRSNAVPIKALISWTLGTYIGTFNGTSFSCAGNLSSCSIYLASPIRKGWYQPFLGLVSTLTSYLGWCWAYDKWQNKPKISAKTGTSSKKCFRASAPKWPLGPSLATLGDNHIITSGKIRPFLTSNSYIFSPWRPTDFEDLESLPLSLTSNLQSPQQVLKTQRTTSGASRRSQPQAARIVRRQWEGPFQLSSDQNPLRVIDPLSIFSNNLCLGYLLLLPSAHATWPPQASWNFSQPCLTGTLYCPVGCLQHQLMQRIAIQWNGYWYITRFLDPNKGPQM